MFNDIDWHIQGIAYYVQVTALSSRRVMILFNDVDDIRCNAVDIFHKYVCESKKVPIEKIHNNTARLWLWCPVYVLNTNILMCEIFFFLWHRLRPQLSPFNLSSKFNNVTRVKYTDEVVFYWLTDIAIFALYFLVT